MTRTIRRLEPADFDAYHALRGRALAEDPAAFATDVDAWRDASRETIERHLELSRDEPGRPIFGAFATEQLVGMIGMSREARRSVEHKAGLWGFSVLAEQRRAGHGKALLEAAVEHARAQTGLRHLRAVVAASSAPALALLERSGFERYGIEPDARLVGNAFVDQIYLLLRLDP